MTTTSARLGLPLLEAGQAQKELFHNEALARLDLAIGACVEGIGRNDPPVQPALGTAWIVGTMPTGDWTGQAGALAGWTAGGWRFVPAFEGLSVWNKAGASAARFTGGAWRGETRAAAIPDPAGGGIVDAEARAAVVAILAVLRGRDMIGG